MLTPTRPIPRFADGHVRSKAVESTVACTPIACTVVPLLPPVLFLTCPSPSYGVNRDTLFCYHKASEEFLRRLMGLYVASHYKNTPNDLQLLSDAPAHHIFVLLGPVDPSSTSLPEILCVLQVRVEEGREEERKGGEGGRGGRKGREEREGGKGGEGGGGGKLRGGEG